MKIGMLETMGMDWHLSEQYVENIKSVTPEMIMKVANKYLTEDNRYVALLDPLPLDNKVAKSTYSTGNAHDG